MPVHDYQLAGYLRLTLTVVRVAVADIQTLEVEPLKRSADVWMIVDADHHPTLAPAHEVGHALVLLDGEVDAIAGSLPIRRVHVEERVCSIIALGAGEPGQTLDIGACEALPGS